MRRGPARDVELARVLRAAERQSMTADGALAALGARIMTAAAPLLEERAVPNRTVWDYAERWSATLLPIGALTAVAAGLCLFALSVQPDPAPPRPTGARVALLGAATNSLSSQKLIDFLVTADAAQQQPAGRSSR